ncbi:polysaccharide deacetylase family protein [Ruegeria atlantica]|uniref:polysaccharide deacetylase family protein n=1 Tax=Ruegeria atlantica TaxID=81569 RepID=UPI00147E88CF|nr:polysaccharide deacetylase family protein [Ruegeria atlantica]
MNVDWRSLTDELDIWQQQGLTLPLWWRDDDAVSTTPQLGRLTAMSDQLGMPVHLAIIPLDAEDVLVEYVAAHPNLIPVVHGWAHQNHAPSGEKKSEFRLHRPMAEITQDIRSGISRMGALFGDQLCPMFVPPWNRIAPEVVQELHSAGFRILSTATPRSSAQAAPGLDQINTHLDPIDWHGSRGLADPEMLVAKTAQLLQDRRETQADNAEPFGILTHHLVHDEDIWAFTSDLLNRLLDGPGFVWSARHAD